MIQQSGLCSIHRFFGISKHGTEHRFQFLPRTFQAQLIGGSVNPERRSPHKLSFGKGEGQDESVPTGKDFFFEQAKVSGTIGSPVA